MMRQMLQQRNLERQQRQMAMQAAEAEQPPQQDSVADPVPEGAADGAQQPGTAGQEQQEARAPSQGAPGDD